MLAFLDGVLVAAWKRGKIIVLQMSALDIHEQEEEVQQQPLFHFDHHNQIKKVPVQHFLQLFGPNDLGGEEAVVVVVLLLLAYAFQGGGDAVLKRQYWFRFAYTVIQILRFFQKLSCCYTAAVLLSRTLVISLTKDP